jgi:arylsulfatase A-like enzyme
VAFNAAHDPHHAPPAHLHSYDLRGLHPKKDPLPHYQASIQAMDTEIGRLLACLGPQLANTTVIVVGDNGTPADVVQPPMDKKRAKATVYEGGVRVPLIINGPLVNQPGREVCGIVQTLDLFSTIVALAGGDARLDVPCDRCLDSVSLLPYMLDPCHRPLRETVYTEIFWCLNRDCGCAAIRDQRFKVIRKSWIGGPKHEFYDLFNDPLENHDLLDCRCMTPELRAIYQALVNQMETLRASE